jgi:hypothetical protein
MFLALVWVMLTSQGTQFIAVGTSELTFLLGVPKIEMPPAVAESGMPRI